MNPVLVALALTVAARGPKGDKPDPVTLDGEWVVESWIKGGRSEVVREGMGITFGPGGKAVLAERGRSEDVTYTTDAKKDPPHLNIDIPGGDKGPTLTGIYRLDRDTLTLAVGREGDRPTKFESPDGSAVMLMVLKRAKKKD
jgi:uncharacterized protein (TIGR03067 family)